MIRYPRYNRNNTNRITIPQLDGGLNLMDGCTHIADNQLINAKNVWFNGQVLKTRPSVDFKISTESYESLFDFSDATKVCDVCEYVYSSVDKKYVYTNIKVLKRVKTTSNGTSVSLFALVTNLETETDVRNASQGVLTTLDSNYLSDIKVLYYKGEPTVKDGFGIYFVVQGSTSAGEQCGSIYELASQGSNPLVFKCIYKNLNGLGESDGQSSYRGTEVDELYKPIVYVNGKGDKYSELQTTNETEYAPASTYEGKNLLPSAMRFRFMSDGLSTRYYLPSEINTLDVIKVELNIGGFEWTNITESGSYYTEPTLKFTIPVGARGPQTQGRRTSTESYGYKIGDNTYTIQATYQPFDNYIEFGFWDADGTEFTPSKLPQTPTSTNIEITAYPPAEMLWDDFKKIASMTISTEYGGGDGIFGGSRVFLGGYKNFICYSLARENTYFSENNYVAVGDSSTITAFGKMNDLLVIFKPNSIYATQTSYNDNVTAEQVQNGLIGDIATTYCYFPIYQLTDDVGCDVPKSVKLCLNRLIFANTSGDVYCLVTQSSNSQRNVYCLSNQIRSKLVEHKDSLQSAFAVTFTDYYMLICDNKAFVLDFNKDSYRYIYSYTNRTNNASSRHLTWWYWEFEQKNGKNFESAISYKQDVFLVTSENITIPSTDAIGERYKHIAYYHRLNTDVGDEECEAIIETKVFDFGMPERYKKIEKMYIGVGNDAYSEIELTINTDKGEVYHRPLIISDDGTKSTADYGEEVRLFPYCNKIRQFNIKLAAKGIMSIENINIYYKMLGEVMS